MEKRPRLQWEVTYQPSASFFGVDYLTYEICNADGTQCSQADVEIYSGAGYF